MFFHFNWYGAIFMGKKHIFFCTFSLFHSFHQYVLQLLIHQPFNCIFFWLPFFTLMKFCNWLKGERVLQDFNIQKEAGGSKRALIKTFEANVTNTIMEIHFFWAGKGTCCIPFQSTYGPLVSAVHVYQGSFISSLQFLTICIFLSLINIRLFIVGRLPLIVHFSSFHDFFFSLFSFFS